MAGSTAQSSALTLQALGYMFLRHGQLKRALDFLRLAMAEAPEDRSVRRTLAVALVRAGRGREALQIIEPLAEEEAGNNSASRTIEILRARALLATGEEQPAREVYRLALGLSSGIGQSFHSDSGRQIRHG